MEQFRQAATRESGKITVSTAFIYYSFRQQLVSLTPLMFARGHNRNNSGR